jgi:DNA-binding NarL/FixJ family response regulator
MSSEKISILLVEDHKIVRKGLKALLELEERFHVVAEAENGFDAVALAFKVKPMIIIMDIAMPVLNGLEATKKILKKMPDAKIIILSAYADDNYIDRALEVGVVGFLVKQCSPGLLVDCILKAMEEELVFSPSIEERLHQMNQSIINNNGLEKKKNQTLSDREVQVLQLIAEGNSNKVIANVLTISIKTVDKHRQNLMKKLFIHDTASLTRYAISEGIIENSCQAVKP